MKVRDGPGWAEKQIHIRVKEPDAPKGVPGS